MRLAVVEKPAVETAYGPQMVVLGVDGDVALPEEKDLFTPGAAATARVEMKDWKYVITIPGPVLLNPQGEDERQLAKKGEMVTFREFAGRFELVHW